MAVSVIHVAERLALISLTRVQGFRQRFLRTSVGAVHVLERNNPRGTLPPVILLHGLSSAAVHYAAVTQHLGAFSKVVLPDFPGHGYSEMPARLDKQSLLSGAFESLDQLVDRPSVLAGTSLGGYVALRYAARQPKNIAALALASPAGAEMTPEELAALRARLELKSHPHALAFVDALFARPNPFRQFVALGLRRYFSTPQTLAVIAEMQQTNLLTAAQLQSLQMPILCLWGDSERILPESNLAFFRAHLPPHARIERPSGWGHSGFLDDPRDFAQRLTHFAAEAT